MNKNKIIESMIKIVTKKFTIRVWRNVTVNLYKDFNDIQKAVDGYRGDSQETLAEIIGRLSDVAAVEVLDKDGMGIVLYPDWK
jgi:hypothetical protein